MENTMNKLSMKNLVFIIVAFLLGFIAQINLMLSHGEALPAFFAPLAGTIIANGYIGFVLYIVAGVCFVIGIRSALESKTFINMEEVERPLMEMKTPFIFMGIAFALYIISLLVLSASDNHVVVMLIWLASFALAAVGLFLADSRAKVSFEIHYMDIILAVVFSIIAYFLYSYNLDVTPTRVSGEEAFFALEVHHMGTAPEISMVFLPQILLNFLQEQSFNFFGYDVFGLRIFSVLFAVLTVFVFYFLARVMFSLPVAIVSTVMLMAYHLFIGLARTGVPYMTGFFIFVLTLLLLVLGIKRASMFYIFLGGFVAGMGYHLHNSAKIAVIVALVYLIVMLIKSSSVRTFILKQAGIFVLAFVLTIMPFLVKYGQEFVQRFDFAPVMVEHGMNHMKSVYNTSSTTVVLLKNAVISLKGFNSSRDYSRLYGNNKSMLDFVSAVLFILSLFMAVYLFKDDRYLLLLVSFIIILISGGMLTIDPPQFPRLGIVLPVVAILVSSLLVKVSGVLAAFIPSAPLAKGTSISVMSVITLVVILLNLNIYFGHYIGKDIADSSSHAYTAIGKYINNMGDFSDIYLVNFKGEDVVYSLNNETIRFLSRGKQAYEITDVEAELPLKSNAQQDVAFIAFEHNYHRALELLRQTYPMGRQEIITSGEGLPVLLIYEVSLNEVNTKN